MSGTCNLSAFLLFSEVTCYYYEIGNKDRAVELLELALKSLDEHGAKKFFQPDLLQTTLTNYKGEEVCYGDVCVVPRPNVSSGATPNAEQENPAERGALDDLYSIRTKARHLLVAGGANRDLG
ncbi:hypothetical protein [Sinorhizobium meliloti]|uniref:hypothetical protein n=1 Tax=Rhizobium meliloti TaxID=382 RepID=UPI00299DF94E|nr:hypothetical protein [Sinorhizobium meliloti]